MTALPDGVRWSVPGETSLTLRASRAPPPSRLGGSLPSFLGERRGAGQAERGAHGPTPLIRSTE
jgi:hypothetical protein